MFNNEVLGIVDEFNYLGMMLTDVNCQKHKICSLAGERSFVSDMHQYIKPFFSVFVTSVLLYAADIWSWHKAFDVENVHVKFYMKVFLSVEPKAVINFMYCELRKLPLAVKIKLGVNFLNTET